MPVFPLLRRLGDGAFPCGPHASTPPLPCLHTAFVAETAPLPAAPPCKNPGLCPVRFHCRAARISLRRILSSEPIVAIPCSVVRSWRSSIVAEAAELGPPALQIRMLPSAERPEVSAGGSAA